MSSSVATLQVLYDAGQLFFFLKIKDDRAGFSGIKAVRSFM